jgi:hypothetical protein
MNRRHATLLFTLLPLALAAGRSGYSGPAPAATTPDHKAAFERLKGLAGTWSGHHTNPDGPELTVEYRLTAGGSALMERLFAGSPHEMLSVYYLDAGELVLTHYCAMANQPRMKLVAGGREGELRFDFVGGTNLDVATSTHIHGGRIAILGPDRFDADWFVWSGGKSADAQRMFMQRSARP